MRIWSFNLLLLLLSLVAVSGCGTSGLDIAPVHGLITLDGQPLAHAGVVFQAEGKSAGGGYTDADGRYELMYKRGVKGAPIGTNRVVITEDIAVTHRQQLPARYNTSSELRREVMSGDNEFNFELTSDPK